MSNSEADSVSFRQFLKQKYGTLDKLNDAWGTVFWNQTYTDWEEIYVLRPTLDRDPKKADDLNDCKWTMKLNEVRSICPYFGVMEQQSGANGWTTRMESPAPRPGQLTLWAMQSVAQGADFISFFRWRTCTVGSEIYWHGILDYDNRDNRKLREVKEFYQKLKTLEPVCGASNETAFALLKDYDNE